VRSVPSRLVVVLAGVTWIAAIGSVGAGCGASDESAPVADSVLVDVFADLHLAGAWMRLEPGETPGLRDSVLARHGLDSASFARSVAWLRDHPEDFVAIYGSVLDRLSSVPDDSAR
jgi:hypothetical protein